MDSARQTPATPQIQAPDPNLFKTDPDSWIAQLQKVIYSVIAPLAIPFPPQGSNQNAQQNRLKLVGQDAMNYWIVAFTHKSFNRNPESNNEVLEHLGDKVTGLTFDKYLITKFPTITESEASELGSAYMSKEFQAETAVNLGLVPWVRILVDRSKHVREDLFEAIFGALFQIGDNIFTSGAGYVLCYNAIVNLFEGIQIDFRLARGHPKTQVKNIFEKLHWYFDNQVSVGELGIPVQGDDGWRLILRFTPIALQDLRTNFGARNIVSDILADARSTSKPAVEKEAFAAALKKLASYGITTDWSDQVSEVRKMQSSDLAPYWPTATNRMQQDGYTSLDFPKPRKGEHVTYVQLVGIRKDGKKDILITIEDDTGAGVIDLQKKALQQYGQQGKDR